MNRLFFFKAKNRGYIQKRPTIYRPIRKGKCVYKMWTRTFHLCFGEGLSHNIQSAEDGLVQCLYRNFKSFLHVQNHPALPRLDWQSCGFLPFPHSQQGYELQLVTSRSQQQFLRSQRDRRARTSLWETNRPPTESHNEQVFSFLLPILYSVSFQDYYPHQTCSFTSLNLEVIWRPTLRKETQSRNEEIGGIQYTPEHLAIHPYDSTAQCTATVCRSILAAWAPRPSPLVKAHQINTRQEEFPGRVRN